MSDAEQTSVEVVEVDYKAMYEKAQEDIAKIAAKKDELLNETKKAKADREAAENAAKKASTEKAAKDGEYEQLWKTTQAEKEELANTLKSYKQSVRSEKVQVAAMRVATELADGDNAELLAEFVTKKLDNMADETGALGADVIKAVAEEFKNSTKYKALLRGSKATGGSAPGNPKATQESKEMKRGDWEQLNQADRGKFFASGGKLTD